MWVSRVKDNVTLGLYLPLFPQRDEVESCLSCVEFVIEAQDVKGSLLNSLNCLIDGLTLKEGEVEVETCGCKKTRQATLYQIVF